MYDFTSSIDRNGTGANKWDSRPEGLCKNYMPLSVADMEFSAAPEIKEALHKAVDHGIYGYTMPDDAYIQALKHWFSTHHNFEIEKDNLVTTQGVISAIKHAIKAFSNEGDEVLIQPPVYYPFKASTLSLKRKIVENPLVRDESGRYHIDFEDLEQKLSRPTVKLMLLCSPHNPVGRIWSKEELTKLVELAKKYEVLIVSDEIHSDLIMPGKTHVSLANIPGVKDISIICTAVSKTFNLAGLMCSNIFIFKPELKEKFDMQAKLDGAFGVPYFARSATIAAYQNAEAWLEELIKVVDDNYKLLKDYIEKHFDKALVTPLEATYLAWVDFSAYFDDEKSLEDFMQNKAGLCLDEGYIFGDEGKGFERFNLALPSLELKEALERLKEASQTL